MDAELMRAHVREAPVGRLGTVGPDGRPRVQPVCFVLEEETLYWAVDFKPKRTPRLRRLADIEANPAVELVVDHYEEDWSRLWWVRLAATASILPGGAEAERALDLLAAKYEQYRERRPEGPVVRLRIDRWAGWSA